MRLAIALLRILAGAGMTWAGVSKLLNPSFLYGGLIHELERHGTPFDFYQRFLSRFVEFNQELFAYATAIGELLVGISLLLGLLVSLAAMGGVFLMANFAMATTAENPVGLAVHVVFAAIFLLLGRTAAGLEWGLDAWLARYLPPALLFFPLRRSFPRN